LNDYIEREIFDVGRLLLDRLAIWSKGSVNLSNPKLPHEDIRGERTLSAMRDRHDAGMHKRDAEIEDVGMRIEVKVVGSIVSAPSKVTY
jgi:hypothetical protein